MRIKIVYLPTMENSSKRKMIAQFQFCTFEFLRSSLRFAMLWTSCFRTRFAWNIKMINNVRKPLRFHAPGRMDAQTGCERWKSSDEEIHPHLTISNFFFTFMKAWTIDAVNKLNYIILGFPKIASVPFAFAYNNPSLSLFSPHFLIQFFHFWQDKIMGHPVAL